jgi:polyisoprenoid-binding protein YceI
MALPRAAIILSACVWSIGSATANAQESSSGIYTLNPAASAVGFTISGSMIFKVKESGTFKAFDGSLSYDPGRPADTHLDLTVYTASIETKNAEHDDLLRSGEFFDVEHFPTMRFVSASTARQSDGTFSMTGDMTIRGITKQLTIPVRLRTDPGTGSGDGAMFESNFQIDRTEFGLNGVPKWGGLKVSISKKVDVHIAIATTLNPPR